MACFMYETSMANLQNLKKSAASAIFEILTILAIFEMLYLTITIRFTALKSIPPSGFRATRR